MKSRSFRVLAVTGAAAVASATMFGGALAGAQTTGNIDTDATGTLTINKYLHQDGTGTGDITGAPDPGFSDPVAGVEFTVYPLLEGGDPVDLGDQAAWDGLATLPVSPSCDTAPDGYTLGDPIVMDPTDTNGVSTVSLPVTAYQVCETDAPSNIVDTALPFLVTIPMPDGAGGWVYDVNAYPKNGETSITKSIEAQEGLGLGAPVQFPVTTYLPSGTGPDLTAYSISDELDMRLAPNGNGVASVTIDGAVVDESYYTVLSEGPNDNTVVVEFTQAGLDWINSGDAAGGELVVVFDTTVVGGGLDGDGSAPAGEIPNSANLWVNNPGRDAAAGPALTPDTEVSTNWGDLLLEKQDSESDAALDGATFEVYAAADPYAADCTAATAVGGPIEVDGETEFTSGAADVDGIVFVPGLFVSDSVNPAIDAEQRCYVVRETGAPAGYVLPTGEDADTGVAVMAGSTVEGDYLPIANTQQTGPDLPLTGGAGTGLLVGLGSVFVLGAGGLALAKRRNDEDQEVTASA